MLIGERAHVAEIIDFGTERVFPATAYISVVFMRRLRDGEPAHDETTVVRIDQLVAPPGLHLREAMRAPQEPDHAKRFTLRLPRNGDAFLLVPGQTSSLVARLQRRGRALRDLADTFQGIRVGAQERFLVVERPDVMTEPALIPVHSFPAGSGSLRTAILERAALRPAVHSEQLQRYQAPPNNLWIIYPYDELGRPVPFGQFREAYPRAGAYLTLSREVLGSRGYMRPDRWHLLARQRDPAWLNAEKILVPQLANEGRMTLDERGLYLVQGWGITLRPDAGISLRALLGVLNSTLLVWLTATGAPRYRGNAFEYKGYILDDLPVPSACIEEPDLQAEIEERASALFVLYSSPPEKRSPEMIAELEAELDARVYEAGRLTSAEVRFVEEEVGRFRPASLTMGSQLALSHERQRRARRRP
jgi:hypothetical protein